ncbi:MAG: hypothetical protein NVS9B3_00800 [Gemmatimonadaceae bacterium]
MCTLPADVRHSCLGMGLAYMEAEATLSDGGNTSLRRRRQRKIHRTKNRPDKSTPVARRGRKAESLSMSDGAEMVRMPKVGDTTAGATRRPDAPLVTSTRSARHV